MPSRPTKRTPFDALEIGEQVETVQFVLAKEVLPMLASHGGGLEIMDIQGFRILIRYHGACHGCPLAGSGTLEFIEHTLQSEIDERIRVIPS